MNHKKITPYIGSLRILPCFYFSFYANESQFGWRDVVFCMEFLSNTYREFTKKGANEIVSVDRRETVVCFHNNSLEPDNFH